MLAMTLSLLWPARTFRATRFIYQKHSPMTVCTSRPKSVVWGVVVGFWRIDPNVVVRAMSASLLAENRLSAIILP